AERVFDLCFLCFFGEERLKTSSWPLNSLGAQVEVIKTLENSCPIGWFGIAKLSMRPCGCGDRWELRFLAVYGRGRRSWQERPPTSLWAFKG
ncbi:hypothetical protein Tco_1374251, partial [Tanacetum coccineum]